MNDKERIHKVIVRFLKSIELRFFGQFLSYVNIQITKSPKVATLSACFPLSGASPYILVSSNFLKEINDKELAFALLHEAYHIVRNEPQFLRGRDPIIWNNHCADPIINTSIILNFAKSMKPFSYHDEVINEIEGISWITDYEKNIKFSPENLVTDGSLIDNNFFSVSGKKIKVSSTDLWNLLPEKIRTSIPSSSFDQLMTEDGDGEIVELSPDQIKDSMIESQANKLQQLIKRIQASGAGTLPLDISDLIKIKPVKTKNWKSIFQEWVTSHTLNDLYPTYFKENKTNPLCPGIKIKEDPLLNVILDVSGSVDNTSFNDFIYNLIKLSESFTINLLQVDTTIKKDSYMEPFEASKVKNKGIIRSGQGGTDMNPGIEFFLKKSTETPIAILTDGYIPAIDKKNLKVPIFMLISKNGNDQARNQFKSVKVFNM